MGKQAKRAYLEAIMGRYRKADRAGKAKILDEFCAVCGYHRKYAIRLLGRKKSTSPRRRPGRRPKYDHPQLLEALRRIWLASDQLCGKRLKVALPLWLPHYEAEHGALPKAVRAGLLAASASTLDRLLKAARVAHPKGLSGTKPGTLLKKQIPSGALLQRPPRPAVVHPLPALPEERQRPCGAKELEPGPPPVRL